MIFIATQPNTGKTARIETLGSPVVKFEQIDVQLYSGAAGKIVGRHWWEPLEIDPASYGIFETLMSPSCSLTEYAPHKSYIFTAEFACLVNGNRIYALDFMQKAQVPKTTYPLRIISRSYK